MVTKTKSKNHQRKENDELSSLKPVSANKKWSHNDDNEAAKEQTASSITSPSTIINPVLQEINVNNNTQYV
ncbi:unnamed protein product [Parnassius apollo]|uniref:(apollo) hypothetical protein n=1 Tax=Parnassius apollo TaxID=110799 RepID=A0A8S3X024_PARAO|nr:unnamed protein product [Parnassius apollo]